MGVEAAWVAFQLPVEGSTMLAQHQTVGEVHGELEPLGELAVEHGPGPASEAVVVLQLEHLKPLFLVWEMVDTQTLKVDFLSFCVDGDLRGSVVVEGGLWGGVLRGGVVEEVVLRGSVLGGCVVEEGGLGRGTLRSGVVEDGLWWRVLRLLWDLYRMLL